MTAKKSSKIDDVIKHLSIGKNEQKVFNLLSKKPLTIKQIVKVSKLSERTIRSCLSDLVGKQFIKKEALIEGQLKYLYQTNSAKSIADIIKEKLSDLEKE
ncbi:MAG: hypothetical protein HY831_00580 [Candidatus Aenigmarchaeota archaeon]|nr:hypothetical protein [Candidatus Aenigmarchaeota archaeon]